MPSHDPHTPIRARAAKLIGRIGSYVSVDQEPTSTKTVTGVAVFSLAGVAFVVFACAGIYKGIKAVRRTLE